MTFFWAQLRYELTYRGAKQAKLWLDRYQIEPQEAFTGEIAKALGELSIIIDTQENESAFQKWFEDNEIIFQCMGYTKVIPHPQIESDAEQDGVYIPDFMALNSSGIWEIIEIKPAKALIMKETERMAFSWINDGWLHESVCRILRTV